MSTIYVTTVLKKTNALNTIDLVDINTYDFVHRLIANTKEFPDWDKLLQKPSQAKKRKYISQKCRPKLNSRSWLRMHYPESSTTNEGEEGVKELAV
jgi:hypothetical protein